MFSSTVKLCSKTETYVIVAYLKIRFLLWVAQVKITSLSYTIVHEGTEKLTERSLLKRD